MPHDPGNSRAELMRLVPLVAMEGRKIVEALAEQQKLHATDVQALNRVMLAEAQARPLTAGTLGHDLGLTSGATTFLINRLALAGWLQRERDTSDRRKVYIRLSEAGRTLTATVYPTVAQLSEAVMDRFTAEELRIVQRFLTETVAAMTSYRTSLSQ